MKQLIQSYKTGEMGLYDVPAPICQDNGILVSTKVSLVSAGTEKMVVDIAKKSLVGKAKARPDLVKQVIDKMKKEGVMNTLEKVFTKLDTPYPLGYSLVGEVIEVGKNVTGTSIGDRVACGGAFYANHSEINYIPKNLFVKVPEKVSDLEGSFVTVGAIALQGVRRTEPELGEKIVVIGLGLIGMLTVQLLKANGCLVLGVDVDPDKLAQAKELGADAVCHADDMINAAFQFSGGNGADAVIIAASTSSHQPVIDAGEISKTKGRVVIVGQVGMNVPRNVYYDKELDLRISKAYGPGRKDPQYEEHGIDYPFPYVRWTEQRNFEAFLDMIDQGKVTPGALITHEFDFNDTLKAYELLEGKVKEKYLGIVLNFNGRMNADEHKAVLLNEKSIKSDQITAGVIGAGNFTKAIILPRLKKMDGFDLVTVCTATGVSAHSNGRKFEFKNITTDADTIFNDPEINTVFVTTPHNDHGPKVAQALRNGKHVFVEKPLCINKEQLDDIRKAYEEQEGKWQLQVGFNRRFSPMVQKIKAAVGDQPLSVNYRINAGVIPKDVWIQDPEIGGGRIIGEVCHFIDTCNFLTGQVPVSVSASCVRKDDQSVPDEDNVSIILNYRNGSTGVINYYAYGNKNLAKEYIEVFADNFAAQLNDFRELVLFKGSKKSKTKAMNQDKGFDNEFKAFRDAVKTGQPAITFEDIYATTLATFTILESLKNNTVISLEG